MKRKAYLTAALKKGAVIISALASMAGALVMTGGTAMALTEAECRSCHGTGTTLSTTTLHHSLAKLKGLGCSACHQQIPDKTGGYTVTVTHDCFVCHVNATHEAVHNTITRPADCGQCHTLSTVDEHTSRGATCGTCHDNAAVQQVIADGKAGLPVSCLSCHAVIGGHAHPNLFSSPECLTCHGLTPVAEHTSRGSTCATCHSSTQATVVKAISDGKAGIKVSCVTCHGAGYNHPAAHTKTYSPYPDCGTCHLGNLPDLHLQKGFGCATCHSTTAPAAVREAVATSAAGGSVYCAACHMTFGNHALQHDKVAIPAGSPDFITTHEQSKPVSYCFGCHTTTTTARVKAIDDGMKGVTVACTTCHPTMIPANVPPTANAGPDVTTSTGLPVTFSGAGSTDPDGTIASDHWNFGDGTSTLNGASVTHTYTVAGSYWVTLTVTDNAGATATDTVIVTVQPGVAYTPVDEALYVTRLGSATTADTNGTRTTITTNFKDNNLTSGYAVAYANRLYNVVTMRVNRDALTTTKVILRVYVSSIGSSAQTVKVYPYLSGFSSVNTGYSSSYSLSGPGWKELDVTSLAQRMNGYGGMKFRLSTTGSFSVSEGNFTLQ